MRLGRAVRPFILATAAALASLTFAGVNPNSVAASHTGACTQGDPSPNFASYPVSAPSAIGAQATLETQSLDVCSGSSDNDKGNIIWAAVDQGSYVRSIVQIGVGRCVSGTSQNTGCDGTMNVVRAWGRDQSAPNCGSYMNQDPYIVRIGEPIAASYTVQKSGSQWQYVVNGSVWDSISSSFICWTGGRALFFGESYDNGDAIGGFSGFPFSLTGAIYLKSGSNWQSPSFVGTECPDRTSPPPTYHCVRINGQAIDFWTAQ